MSLRDEYHRKVRIIVGGLQAGVYCRWMFRRTWLTVAFHYLSFKILKYLTPLWVLVALSAFATLYLEYPSVALFSMVFAGCLSGLAILTKVAVSTQAPRSRTLRWCLYASATAFSPFHALARIAIGGGSLAWRMAERAAS